jgi:hypothetical protein
LRKREPAPEAPVDIDAVLRRYAREHPQPVASDDSAGVEGWSSEPRPKAFPLPPEHYPRSGHACLRCYGTEDPRCCQYKNQIWDVPE